MHCKGNLVGLFLAYFCSLTHARSVNLNITMRAPILQYFKEVIKQDRCAQYRVSWFINIPNVEEVCMLLQLSNSSPPKQTLCLCVKDGSPVSTCSSSPKLDWMIKRGMVGLFPNCAPVLVWLAFHHPLSLGCVLWLHFTIALLFVAFVTDFLKGWIDVCMLLYVVCLFLFTFFFGVHSQNMTFLRLHCPDMLHHCNICHVLINSFFKFSQVLYVLCFLS